MIYGNRYYQIEKRYDLSDTKIYIHGDGASWIESGLDWFNSCNFVLDKYHKNKAIYAMVACLREKKNAYFTLLNNSLLAGNKLQFEMLTKELSYLNPERADKILNSAQYLTNNISGIQIYSRDPESNNGGSTEPHVSNLLARRLSSRPMGWSKKTLKYFAPLLVCRDNFEIKGRRKIVCKNTEKFLTAVSKTISNNFKSIKHNLGLVFPDSIGKIPILTQGKHTAVNDWLKNLCHN